MRWFDRCISWCGDSAILCRLIVRLGYRCLCKCALRSWLGAWRRDADHLVVRREGWDLDRLIFSGHLYAWFPGWATFLRPRASKPRFFDRQKYSCASKRRASRLERNQLINVDQKLSTLILSTFHPRIIWFCFPEKNTDCAKRAPTDNFHPLCDCVLQDEKQITHTPPIDAFNKQATPFSIEFHVLYQPHASICVQNASCRWYHELSVASRKNVTGIYQTALYEKFKSRFVWIRSNLVKCNRLIYHTSIYHICVRRWYLQPQTSYLQGQNHYHWGTCFFAVVLGVPKSFAHQKYKSMCTSPSPTCLKRQQHQYRQDSAFLAHCPKHIPLYSILICSFVLSHPIGSLWRMKYFINPTYLCCELCVLTSHTIFQPIMTHILTPTIVNSRAHTVLFAALFTDVEQEQKLSTQQKWHWKLSIRLPTPHFYINDEHQPIHIHLYTRPK